MFNNIGNRLMDIWNSIHPALQLIISLGLLSQLIRRLLLGINEIIKLKTHKESVLKQPQKAIDLFRIRLLKGIYNTLKFGRSYRTPKQNSKIKEIETTHRLKIYRYRHGEISHFSSDQYIRELQTSEYESIDMSLYHNDGYERFDTAQEALGHFKRNNKAFTYIKSNNNGGVHWVNFNKH